MWLRTLFYVKKVFETFQYSEEELRAYQDRMLDLVVYSAVENRYYDSKLFDNEPESQEYEKMPIVDREKLKESGYFSKSFDDKNDVVATTSGTSGERMKVFRTRKAADWLSAVYVRSLIHQGYRPGQSIAQFGQLSSGRSWIGKKVFPTRYIQTDKSLEQQARILEGFQPDVIDYFPSTLSALAKWLDRNDKKGLIDPDLIILRGELSTNSIKKQIEEVFEAPVKEQYGTTEFGILAWESGDSCYHIAEDSVKIEVLDQNENRVEKGHPGRIIVSGLVNELNPLLRYELGDIVELCQNECDCGSSFINLRKVRGRTENVFRNSSGKKIYPDQVIDIIFSDPDILYPQLVVNDQDYEFNYVLNDEAERASGRLMAKRLEEELDIKPIKVQERDKIDLTSGGKLRSIINNREDKVF